jgi:glycosyltransferase involved in cell wall biosynthesis
MREKYRVLHVVNWYPNPMDAIEALFIKEQIDALHSRIESDVLLVQVRYGKFKMVNTKPSSREHIWILQLPLKSWLAKEWISSLALLYFLKFGKDLSRYRLINVHVAYPLLTFFHFFRRFIKIPIVITEHWSGYHFNFGVKKELKRIKRIFSRGMPVVTVSRALAKDIVEFSGCEFPTFQVPNVVNREIFNGYRLSTGGIVSFFMFGCWQFPKVPLVVLEALSALHKEGYSFHMRIGGYGPYVPAIEEKIEELHLDAVASYVGRLTQEEAAEGMRDCSFYVHASEYETFALVCAEALCCGAPVIASAVGGIVEYIDESNGILVATNSVESWVDELKRAFELRFDRERISNDASSRFSSDAIGSRYQDVLNQILQTNDA